MKKLLSLVLALSMLPTVAFAADTYEYADFMETEVAELKTLLNNCKSKGIKAEYEETTYNILNWYVSKDYMLKDEKKMKACEESGSKCGKSCTDTTCELRGILEYNEAAMLNMYNKAKANLKKYVAGTSVPEGAGIAYDFSEMYVDGNILRDKNDKAIFSVGYASTLSTSWDLTELSGMGSTNAVVSKPLSLVYTKNVAKDWVTQNDGTSGKCTYTKETTDGNSVIKVVKTSDSGSFFVRQDVAVTSGENYTLTLVVKGTSVGSSKINIYNSESRENIASKDILAGKIGESWQEIEYSFTPKCSKIDVEFLLKGTTTELFIDEIRLVKTGTTNNLLSNPGFEEAATTNINKFWLKSTLNLLKQAKEGNSTVSFLISPHYFPDIAGYENDTTLYAKNSDGSWKTNEFIKFNINHPKAKEVIEDYLRTIGELFKNDPNVSALSNIILTNESAFDVRNFESYYLEDYKAYLKKLYNEDIKTLNKAWGTSYWFWSQVDSFRNWCSSSSAAEYDTIRYNEDVFTEWHKWMADILKEYLPDVEISTKTMSYIDLEANPYWQIGKGTNLDKFGTFSDLAGNDAYTFSSYSEPVSSESFTFKMMWYDFLYSVMGKPVYNSEDHIIAEGDNRYSAEMRNIVRADLWQGAMHGRGMTSIWDFSTHDYNNLYDTDSTNNYLFTTRPDVMEEVAHTGLNLRKYSDLLETFNEQEYDVAILYSEASRMHVNLNSTETNGGNNPGSEHLRQMFAAYKGALFAGAKVGFVTEDNPKNLHNYRMLIVPAAEHVSDSTITEIEKFIADGKTVVLANNCFKYNEYHTKKTVSISGATTLTATSEADYRNVVMQLLENDEERIFVKNSGTSQVSNNIEWRGFYDDGKVYVNLMNYGDAENVSVYYKGEELTGGKNLLEGDSVSRSFSAGKFQPMLIEYDLEAADDDATGIYGFEVSDNGTISWKVGGNCEYEGVMVYRVTTTGLTKVGEVRNANSFVGTQGETYEICMLGETEGTRITIGGSGTFAISVVKPNKFDGNYKVTVSSQNPSHAYGVVTMIARDEEGCIFKKNRVSFTANGYETRQIDFLLGKKAHSVEFIVYDNEYSCRALSNSVEFTK